MNYSRTCPFCETLQEADVQTAVNSERGPKAFRCIQCQEPQYTDEAMVVNVLRVTKNEPVALSDCKEQIWDVLREEVRRVGGDLHAIIVNVAVIDGEMAGSLLSPSLRWHFFRLDAAGVPHIYEARITGRAIVKVRRFLEEFQKASPTYRSPSQIADCEAGENNGD